MIDRIKNGHVLVVGMARSGLAAVHLLLRCGAARITANDHLPPEKLGQTIAALKGEVRVTLVTGGHPKGLISSDLSLVVKSPGVPPDLELFALAREKGIPVIPEIELAYPFLRAPLVGITGTNGKTTTTALTAAILEEALQTAVTRAGNIGLPLCEAAASVDHQSVAVAELSSFQLEDLVHFRPAVGLFLNFAEDHLDYHGSMERYFQAKTRLFANQGVNDCAVLNAADPSIAALVSSCRGRVVFFDRSPVSCGVGLENGWITLYPPGGEQQRICHRDDLLLPGEHNLENALAASAASWAAGAHVPAIASVLKRFQSIAHRLEHVACRRGVEYINDSKGTNPGATIRALLAYPQRGKVLIAGGKDKGSSFKELAAVMAREVRLLIALGETKEALISEAERAGVSSCCRVDSLQEAVAEAWRRAQVGEVVLLSPACASWDMFQNYEERGELFRQLVLALPESGEEDPSWL